jgi:S-formylglutathione hydrolase FrmB
MDLIVVMPDVGNSWYVNWAKSEGDQKNNWEDAIIKDLIGHIDATYRTIAKREGRGINGLSMGGFGGLMLGLKHPDLFCTVGSHSGAVAYAKSFAERMRDSKESPRSTRVPSNIPDKRIGIENFSSQAERTPKGSIFTKPEECDTYDPFLLILKLPKEQWPHLYFDCGTEDRLITSNLAFMKVLTDNKIPFTFCQSPGGHVPSYWAREVGNSMAAQYSAMKKQLAKVKD